MGGRNGVRWSHKHARSGLWLVAAAVVVVLLLILMRPPLPPVQSAAPLDGQRGRSHYDTARHDGVDNFDNEWRLVLQAVSALKEHLADAPRPPVIHQHEATASTGRDASLAAVLASTRWQRRALRVGRNDAVAEAHDSVDPITADQDQLHDTILLDSTLFVSMASFRDAECAPTLLDMFRTALRPVRVFVGVVEQSDPLSDPPCISDAVRRACWPLLATTRTAQAQGEAAAAHNEGFWGHREQRAATASDRRDLFCIADNIRVRRTRPHEARGPTFGRYVAASMYQGETFFMMIDSHNRFVEAWDRLIVREYLRTVLRRRQAEQDRRDTRPGSTGLDRGDGKGGGDLPSTAAPMWPEKVIISHYPAAYSGPHVLADHGREPHMRLMCSGHFLETGILRLDAESIPTPSVPVRQPFTAAGFLFANASLLQDVPFDKHLDFLFDGEEVLYSARAFTWGWDSYLPTINIMYHFYGRQNSPKVWSVPNNLWWIHQKASHIRVLMLLNQTADVAKFQEKEPGPFMDQRVRLALAQYGMGPARSVEQFWSYAGIDPKSKRHTTRGGASMYCRLLLVAKS